MVGAMPRCDPDREIACIVTLLGKLSAGPPQEPPVADADADIDIDIDLVGSGSPDHYNSDIALPDESHGNGGGGGSPEGFRAVAVGPVGCTVEVYCNDFAGRHGRAFQGEPLPGAQQATPSVLQARVLAARLGVRQPKRHPVALQPEFATFYNPDHLGQGQRSSKASTTPSQGQSVLDLYQPKVLAKRGSKLRNAPTSGARLYTV